VFVVGCSGDGAAAAQVLFERESVQRDSAPRRAPGQGVAADAEGCAGTVSSKWAKGTGGPAGDECYNLTTQVSATIAARFGNSRNNHEECVTQPVASTLGNRGLRSHTEIDGHGAYIPVAFRKSRRAQSVNDHETWLEAEQANTLNQFDTGERDTHAVAQAMTVRRLTPRECERLQGFPDDWTMIPWRKKTAEDCPDGPRYRALGNSMAVNVMAWIGERIDNYERTSNAVRTEG